MSKNGERAERVIIYGAERKVLEAGRESGTFLDISLNFQRDFPVCAANVQEFVGQLQLTWYPAGVL